MSADWEHYRKRKIRRDQRQRKGSAPPPPPRVRPGTRVRDFLEDPRTPSKP